MRAPKHTWLKVYWHRLCGWVGWILRINYKGHREYHETAELIYMAQLAFGIKDPDSTGEEE